MNAERLLALYDRAADAPDAVSRLRRFVLDLAVRGRLAPRDLSADGASWKTVKLGDVCEVLDKLRKPITKKNRVSGEYPYYGATGIVDWVADYIFDEKLVLVGEDGAKWGSGDRTAFIAEGKYWVNNHAHVLRPIEGMVTHEWLAYYLTSIDLLPWVTGLTVPKLNQTRLRSIPIPLPPLTDQGRIVAKVDELMALCDRLEASRNERENTRDRLTKAGLARLRAPGTDDASFQSHARFAVDVFPALTARADQVKRLRRTILDLAVRGKLAPQDLSADGASWKTVKLGDVCKMYQPKTISVKEMKADGDYPVYGANGVIGRYDKYNHENPQLLVTCRGATCGSVNISAPFSWINGNAMVIQPDETELSLHYMKYVFRGGIELGEAITGTAQPQITQQALKPLEFSYPPLADQQRIVAKIDELMVLCDRLEAGLDTVAKGCECLLESVVRAALEPAASERAV